MKIISTSECPPPAGHYSQGIVHHGLLYVSGMLAVDPKTGEKKLGSIEEQTQQALDNVDGVLRAAGTSRDKVIKCTCYVSDIALWGQVNAIYTRFFGDHKPARAMVPTRELHFGFLVEIECIATVEE